MANKKTEKKITQFKLDLNIRSLFIISFILLFGYLAIRSINTEVNKAVPEKSISLVVEDIRAQKVKKAEIIDNKILIYYKNDTFAQTYKEPNDSFIKMLRDSNIDPSKTQIVIKDLKDQVES